MLRWVKTRLVVEKPSTHEKYYPTVLSATTQSSYPFSIPYAEIYVASNVVGSTSSYVSQFRFNDIVRLQVSIKMNPNEYTVWQDIFEGRIVDMYVEYGTNNDVKLYCQGHIAKSEKDIIEETYSYATSTDARTVLSHYSSYLSTLTYSADYADTGVLFPTYDTTANQIYMSDLFSDMEKVSGYGSIISAVPTYSGGNLSTVYVGWNEFSDTVTDQYKIIEGTSRLLDANFSTEGNGIYTAYRVNGDGSYTGYASDATLISTYGKWTGVDTQTWIQSDNLAASIASGVLSVKKMLETSGQVILMGTPEAHVGDLAYCKCPSEDLNGSSIDDNFSVYRVEHRIVGNEYTTTLDVGKVRKTAYDFYADTVKIAKTCAKNQV